MLKTISDKLLSLWPNHTSDIEKVSAGSKRKRPNDEWDVIYVDQDVHLSRMEKKRKIESSNTIVGTIKTSVINMAQWLRPSSSRPFSEEFNIKPISKKGSASTSLHNGDPKELPHSLFNRHYTNHRFSGPHNVSHHRGLTSNGGQGEEMRNGNETDHNVSRRSSRSSIFQQPRPSTASMCFRLKDKEEYKKLLKLQSQRSPWQQPMSFGVSKTSSITNDLDAISISSENSYDQNLQRTSIAHVKTKPREAAYSSPTHKMTPSNNSIAPALMSNLKGFPSTSLINTLCEQRRRSNMNVSFRKPTVAVHDDTSFISNGGNDGPHRIRTLVINEKIKSPPISQSEAVVVIDDDDDDKYYLSTALKSTLDANTTAPVKDKQAQKGTDFRVQANFLQSRYMNDKDIEDERRARTEEQKRRQLLIEEEEMKAKAYAEKRRAQEISLDKSLKYQMRIFDDEPEVTEEIFREEEEEEEKLPELTREMEEVINNALRPGSANEVLSEEFRLQITRGDIKTLSGLNWLNDEVINFYMNLLMRSGEKGERSKLYAFNTFFYPKIKTGGHAAVKRWTKNVDIFAMHYIIIPVHLGVHWCLCVADMENKVITYYDSMGASNNQCLCAVLQYIQDESIAKNYSAFKRNEWKLVNAEDNPQQMNGGDCGMFMCMYAEYITRGREITFTQEHMPYFRRRMVYEIISKRLLH